MFLLQLVLLKAVLALRKSVNKLRSRDITELMMLCSVSQQWRSAFSITMRHRLKALLRCEFIYTVDIALSVVKRLGVYAGYRCGNKCAHFCISLVVTFVVIVLVTDDQSYLKILSYSTALYVITWQYEMNYRLKELTHKNAV